MLQPGKPAKGLDVAYVARLAQLELTAEELESFQKQLGKVEEHFSEISKADVSGLAAVPAAGAAGNGLREDAVLPGLDRAAALENAPMHDGAQILAPVIIA